MDNFLNTTLFGNSVFWYIVAIDIFLATWIIVFLIHKIILRNLQKTIQTKKSKWGRLIVEILEQINWSIYLTLALNTAQIGIKVSAWVSRSILIFTILVIAHFSAKITHKLIKFWVSHFITTDDARSKASAKSMAYIFNLLTQLTIWLSATITIMLILEINITALVGTLGIGGIAIAFALQNVLSDVFASFSIYFDRPFAVGDIIQVDTDKGMVEQIGIKSTRIKTLDGQMLIVPNKELTSLRVQNFSHIKQRRVKLIFGVHYETSNEKLKLISKRIPEIISSHTDCTIDYCNFANFSDFSLDFEIVYFINVPIYQDFTRIREEVNLEIKHFIESENIRFAFPTQVIQMINKDKI